LGGDADADFCFPHFGKADGSVASVGFVLEFGFGGAEFGKGPREVAVPFHGVQCEVEMGVEEEHFGVVRRTGNVAEP
jgi:hypothetical protein